MQFLTTLVILACTLAWYAGSVHIAPGAIKFLPEAMSVAVVFVIVIVGARQRFRLVAPQYWIAFFAMAAVMVVGVLANPPPPGPLIGGIRFYLRAIPLFFLPALFEFSETQILKQLRLLLGVCLLQVPISIYQRHHVFSSGHNSGDTVYGTLTISSILSIFLIAAICIATGLMLRGRLSKRNYFILFVLFIIPTTINETKGTLVLLPIGLIATFLIGSPPGKRIKVALSTVLLLTVFGGIFVPIYDFFAQSNNKYPYTLESFFSDKKQVGKYLDSSKDLGDRKKAGRIDSLTVPLQTFASDPVKLMLGVTPGNASISTLGPDYTGQYNELLGPYAANSSGSAFLIEIGILGLLLALLLDWFIFRDTLFVARTDSSLIGALAVGWVGVTVVMVVGTFYKNIHAFESLSYLFWYFSGLIAAQRMRLTLNPPRTRPVAARPAPAGPESGPSPPAAPGPRLGIRPVARPASFHRNR